MSLTSYRAALPRTVGMEHPNGCSSRFLKHLRNATAALSACRQRLPPSWFGMKPRLSLWKVLACALLSAPGVMTTQAQHVPAEIRNELRKSTVWVRTANDGDYGTGTGFVIRKDGDDVYIATNHHVTDAQRHGQEVDIKRTRYRVLFAGEDPNGETYRADLIAADAEHDLAILKLKRADAPEPFNLYSEKPLEETLPVTVLGFPSGDRDITINNGQISGFKNDIIGGMRRIKVFCKVDPGNSGGPLVDAEGNLLGVIVEKDPKLDNVGYAIPAYELHEMLKGRLGNFEVRQEGESGDYTVQVRADVLDPYGKLKSAKLHYITGADLKPEQLSKHVGSDGLRWSLFSKEMKAVPVSIRDDKASMTVNVPGEFGEFCFIQLSYQREGMAQSVSRPLPIILGGSGDLEEGEDGESKKSRPGRRALPRAPQKSILGERVAIRDFRANEWLIDSGEIIPNVDWDENGLYVFMVTKEGVVRKIDPFRNQIDLEIDLELSAQWAVLSGEGVLVLTKDQQLWIVDDRDLKVRRVIREIPGVMHVASCRKSFYAFCVVGDGTTLEVYDLVDGAKTQTFQASDFSLPKDAASGASALKRFNHLTMGPYGRFLYAESDGAIYRFMVTDDELTLEEATPKIGKNPSGIVVSEDGLYVSLLDDEGNHSLPELSIQPFGVYVYKMNDFSQPLAAVDGGQPTPYLEREDSSRSIFGTVKNSPLVRFDLEGTKVREFPELEGEFAKQILVYPKRPGFLLVLTDAKAYVLKQL